MLGEMHRIFLLSPANTGGKRAQLIFNAAAQFELARRLRGTAGVPLGEIFAFLSGLYFRGKLAYARRFACPPPGCGGIFVITNNRGLLPVDQPVTLSGLRSFARVQIDHEEPRYRRPLEKASRILARSLPADCSVVLLGSISTPKYVEILRAVFGPSLVFPLEFVGRGDMSRGGLLLRCTVEGRELEYGPLDGSRRRGKRPPRLEKWRGGTGLGLR